MERLAWTDERLDELARRMDAGLGKVDREIRELRDELRLEMAAMRNAMNRVGGGIVVGLVGVIAAVFANGG
jgi:hypothetical protein